MQNVRSIRPLIGPEELAHRRLRQFRQVIRDLLLPIPPRKIGVRLAEAELRQPVHDLRPRKRLRKKEHLRMIALDLRNRPLPERKCLGVRIVDAKDRDAHADPVDEDALQLLPHSLPVFAFKIEGIDVLIFLRRILRILNGPVRPLLEPVLMLLYVGMIGRCLERDIQRDGQIELGSLRDKALEILNRSQSLRISLCPPFAGADRPRTSKIARLATRDYYSDPCGTCSRWDESAACRPR